MLNISLIKHIRNNLFISTIAVLVFAIIVLSLNAEKLFKTPVVDMPSFRTIDSTIYTGTERGSFPGAPVDVFFFADLECPGCAAMFPSVKLLKFQYGEKANFIFKHFPLNIHKHAELAAEASECARDQYMFWDYVEKVYQNNKLSKDDLLKYAEDLNLDTEKFTSCIENHDKKTIVENDFTEAILTNIKGTPAFVINGKLFYGYQTKDVLRLAINEAYNANTQGDQ